MSRPSNCRHCASMCCGDVNWCDEHDEAMSDIQILVHRNCPDFRWCRVDALTFEVWWEDKPPRPKHMRCDGQMELEVAD